MRRLIIGVLGMVIVASLSGQSPVLQFDHITTDEGLSSSSIVTILQDYKGFIWIGTYNGLNRYDGHNFEIFRNDPFDTLSIYSNYIWSMFEDSNQKLYVGTVGGLSEFDQKKNIFINHNTLRISPMYQSSWIVRCILEDDQKNLWLATNLGLIKFNRIENTITQYQSDPNNEKTLSNSNIEHIILDNLGNIWVSTWNGLSKFNPETEKAIRYLYNPDKGPNLDEYSFMDLLLDKNGDLWVATYGTGLFKVNNISGENPIFKLYKNDPNDNRSLSGDRILSMFMDNKDRFWIGTENRGLNLYDWTNDKFWQFHKTDYDPKSLNNESINAIFEDFVGNIWVGTYAGGINILKNSGNRFKTYQNMPGAPLSLSNNTVTAFLEDHKKNIWIATDGGGVNLLDEKTGTFKHYNSHNTNLNSDNVLSITECKDQTIWISTWAGGISRFNTKNKSFNSYTTVNSAIHDNNIFSLIEDENDNLWLGSFQHGLIRFDKHTESFKNYSVENTDLLSNMIVVIKDNKRGSLLLGTNLCFSIFDIAKEKITNYLNNPEDPGSISSNSVYDISIENDTSIWIATQNGLNQFNPSTNNFRKFFISDSLPDNIIKGLVFDSDGLLWITTNKGICSFNTQIRKVIRIFTREDGLQGNEFNNNSVYPLKDGRILVGGTSGFSLIDPGKLINNTKIPEIRFTDFLIFNERVRPGPDSPIEKHISECDQITLHYDQNMITFRFAVMDFTQPEKNQYAYKMGNFDHDWIYSGNQWSATYTNLNPGDYLFRVIGSNNDGVWNRQGISVKITILPPWWQTIWFKTLVILFIVTLFIGIYLFRVNQLKKQKYMLEYQVAERTREIEEKNTLLIKQTEELNESNALLKERQQLVEEQSEELLTQAEKLTKTNRELRNANATKDKFFSIIAHDLKNPFTSILGFSELLKTKYTTYTEEKKLRLISMIHGSAENIYRLLENLLQWSRSQTGNIQYNPTIFNLSEVVTNNIELFRNQLREKHITIINRLSKEITVFADRNMINTIIRNLISNAVKFTEEGKIEIELVKKDDFFELTIMDTGIGIPGEKLEHIFKIRKSKSTEGTMGEMGTGLGLIICKEFAEINRAKITATSQVDIGSAFTLHIPVNKDNTG